MSGLNGEFPYEIFEPDRDRIQPDSGGNSVLGVKHQPDMNLPKKMCRAVLESRAIVWLVSLAEGWPDRTPTRAQQEPKISCMVMQPDTSLKTNQTSQPD